MQAVLLMAGKGTRMAKHYDGPKQLLPVDGKPVVEHMLDNLPDSVDELIFVVGGPHEQAIRNHFAAGRYDGRSVTFVVQEEQLGLAHAFNCAAQHVRGQWLGLIADDIFGKEDIAALVSHDGLALLAYKTDHPENFGVLVTDEDDNLVSAVEKPQEYISDLIWTGAMKMDEDYFSIDVEPSARGEYETPDVWMKLVHEQNKEIKVIPCSFWLPINDKDQLEKANRVLEERNPKH